MIKFTSVTKRYSESEPALKDVSFHIKEGQFAFLTGHSGSGKSTVLRIAHLAERPSLGDVYVNGFSSRRTIPKEIWRFRRQVGFVFQDFQLLPNRTALENIAFVLEVINTPSKEIDTNAQILLEKIGMQEKKNRLVEDLSGGERQQVAIGRALAGHPALLLADEPTGNLDIESTKRIMDLFWKINQTGTTILMATHDLNLIGGYPEAKLLELEHGKLISDSPTKERC
ncbi:MAG: cell division ATP-binding protein FtsE [Gemmatimonadetes bacterium]|uniref:ABC transporter domain-containing protein n=1 Tax=marine metagenome TaxID=408172 RepID=A0A381Z6S9_9ZZZZ|nr:cell division ATP-binding protein FtsE [Gemmatimonadota bacterium]